MQTHSYPLPFSRPERRPQIVAGVPGASSGPRRLLTIVWEALKAVGASRGRRELLALAREHEALRPAFAAKLRDAANRGWL